MIVLSHLPGDVLLEVFKHLLLPDPISLFMTCTALYGLSKRRCFWISVLETAGAERPLSCPSHDNLSDYDMESLKRIAFRWLRLEENWNRQFPRIVGPVRSMSCGGPVDIIAFVPGTDIVILRLQDLDRLLCWDIASAMPFDLGMLESNGRVLSASEPYEKCGEYAIALLTTLEEDPGLHVHVISIVHKNRKALVLRHSFRQQAAGRFYYEEAFLHEDVVGFIGIKLHENQFVVQAFNLTTREAVSINIRTDHSLGPFDQIACFGFGGHIYVALEQENYLHVHHCPRGALPYSRLTEKPSTMDLSPEGPFAFRVQDDPYDPLCITLPSTALYGVNAVFVRDMSAYARDSTDDIDTIIRFSPNCLTGDFQSPLSFRDAISLTATLPGKLHNQRLSLIWLDHSGSNLLALMELSGTLSLKLVRYDRHKASVSVHSLHVPSSIDLQAVSSLAIDETHGAVILVNMTGDLLFLPYVL